MSSDKAFTLLEIIIAISLIAIFVTLPILAYGNYLKKTRDTQRKNGINQIQAALEQYRANNGKYPDKATWENDLVSGNYLPSIPKDPLDGQGIAGENGVYYGFDYTPSSDGQSYTLSSQLEENQPGGTGASNEYSHYIVVPEGPKIIHTTPGVSSGGLPTNTPIPTSTILPTSIIPPTITPTPTPTNTPIPTSTILPTITPTPTRTPTPTNTPTRTPTPTVPAWIATNLIGAPAARQYAPGVWTGTQMIVVGGCGGANGGCGTYFDDGGKYNLTTNTWTPVSAGGYATLGSAAFWTGSEVLTWGCFCDAYGGGGRYNPTTNTWTGMSHTGEPGWPEAKVSAATVWTGSEMIAWGGYINNSSAETADGARYNPTTNTWTPMTSTNAPSARDRATTVWTGTEMIVWGGDFSQNIAPYNTGLNTGARYNPTSNTWTTMSTTNAPSGRYLAQAVWTGATGDSTTANRMIVWGGVDPNTGTRFYNGKMYNPATNTWSNIATPAITMGVYGNGAVWTGNTGDSTTNYRMIVWGGDDYNDGGIYNPATDTWTAMSKIGVPAERVYFSYVWTGTKMIIWGGNNPSVNVNTGGIFDPR